MYLIRVGLLKNDRFNNLNKENENYTLCDKNIVYRNIHSKNCTKKLKTSKKLLFVENIVYNLYIKKIFKILSIS